jgi:hypothetical protein
MTFATRNAEILALFTATGKDIPHEDSDMGRAVEILQMICDSQSHTIPFPDDYDNDATLEENQENVSEQVSDIFDALEELEANIGTDDFTLDFDGNEYRLIKDSEIWEIYVDAIKETVEDCYSDVINLDKMPSFIAVSIDWEKTAQNAYVDGYGHQFSGYDGSEEEAAGYWIFRVN